MEAQPLRNSNVENQSPNLNSKPNSENNLEKESIVQFPTNHVETELPSTSIFELPATVTNANGAPELLESLPLAEWHLQNYPFRAPEQVQDKVLWYEGSFDPTGPHHIDVFESTFNLGFQRGVFAICHQNPLKPDSTPFETRVELAKSWLLERGFKIAETMNDPGIYIEADPHLFQFHKLRNFYDNSVCLLMGPDNFQKYYSQNVPWTHIKEIRENSQGLLDYGFQRMYNEVPGFAERVIVYPRVHHLHATDLRNHLAGDFNNFMPNSVKEMLQMHYPKKVAVEKKSKKEKTSKPQPQKQPEQIDRIAQLSYKVKKTVTDTLNKSISANSVPVVSMNVGRMLGKFDTSELMEIKSQIHKAMHRKEPLARFKPAVKQITDVSDEILSSLLHCDPHLSGIDLILNLMGEGKSFIFTPNHRGGLDRGLIPYALRAAGLSEVANRLVFAGLPEEAGSALEKNIILPSVSELPLVAHNQPLSQSDLDQGEREQAIDLENGRRIAKRLERGHHVVLFPETHANVDSVGICNEAISSALGRENFGYGDFDPRQVYIVPVATMGAEPAFRAPSQESVWATEDMPYSVRFGSAICLSDLQDIFESGALDPNGNSHLFGQMIAQLLPVEKKGTYGYPENSNLPRPVHKQIQLAQELLDNIDSFRIHKGAASRL